MEKQAEETLLEQVKKTLGGYRDQVADFWDDNMHTSGLEQGLLTSKDFLKRYAAPAAVTTLGAGALAGGLTAQGERPGETKRERTMRILRNAAIASGATGLGWLGASGVVGLDPLTEVDSIADLTKERDARHIDTDISAGYFGEDDDIPPFSLGTAVGGGLTAASTAQISPLLHANRVRKSRAAELKPQLNQYKQDLADHKIDRKGWKTTPPKYRSDLFPGGRPQRPVKPSLVNHPTLNKGPFSAFAQGEKGYNRSIGGKRGIGGFLLGGLAPSSLLNLIANNSDE